MDRTTIFTAANEVPPMRPLVVEIKRGSVARLTFPVMAVDSMTAAVQHQGLLADNEYLNISSAERYRARNTEL